MGEMFLLVNFALIEIGFALENSPNRQPARSSVNGLNGAQRLNDWNDSNGPIPTLVPDAYRRSAPQHCASCYRRLDRAAG